MKKTKNSYKKSGVDIKTADKFVKYIANYSVKEFGKKTNNSFSSNIGGFGSVFDIGHLNIKNPLIVSSTDGVGTKLEIANKLKKFDTIGIDLVAMCVNDLVVQGAKPIFFLDYIATEKIRLRKMKSIIKGIVSGCKISNCILAGGETAEMPGTYEKNKFDLAGFAVGIVSKNKIITKNKVKNNDIILAVPSSGVHSNGYSLIRHILKKTKINKYLKKELLKPTKIYVREILNIVDKKLINASANITGGGIVENIPRSIPKNLCANIDLSKIKISKIFNWIRNNNVTDLEMLKTFNCGVGFCLILNKKNKKKVLKYFSNEYKPYEIGYVSKSKKKLIFSGKLKW